MENLLILVILLPTNETLHILSLMNCLFWDRVPRCTKSLFLPRTYKQLKFHVEGWQI